VLQAVVVDSLAHLVVQLRLLDKVMQAVHHLAHLLTIQAEAAVQVLLERLQQ
jgi:hypothetical protein